MVCGGDNGGQAIGASGHGRHASGAMVMADRWVCLLLVLRYCCCFYQELRYCYLYFVVSNFGKLRAIFYLALYVTLNT